MEWFTTFPVPLQSAFVGAAASIIVIFLRDLILKFWQEHRAHRASTAAIFRKYAEPLASAARSLLWRLHEVFYIEGRGAFLKGEEPVTPFEDYKRVSTMYRLAALLGWIRALRRELSFFKVERRKQLASLNSAIHSLESALADGPHVELQGLEALASLWSLELPPSKESRLIVAIALARAVMRRLHAAGAPLAMDCSDEEQIELCREAATLMTGHLNANPVPVDVLAETRARAVQQLSIRESWLYRDWPAGIGDLMIQNAPGGERAFEVIGFSKFEAMVLNGTDEQKRWIARLHAILVKMDVSVADRFDARVGQLRRTLLGTAAIVKALAAVRSRHPVVDETSMQVANKVLLGNGPSEPGGQE